MAVAKSKLKEVLRKKKISLNEFARMTGIARSTIGRYVKSDYDPKLSTLTLWAKALGVKVRDLLQEQ